jgi:tetratricopeptide (TPR) repeat protein
VQNNLGIAHFNLAEYTKARECYEKSLGVCQRLEMQSGIAHAHANLGELDLCEGNYEAALHSWETAQKLYEAMGSTREIADAKIQTAHVWLAIGGLDEAGQLLVEAESDMQIHELHSLDLQLEYLRARIHFHADRFDEAFSISAAARKQCHAGTERLLELRLSVLEAKSLMRSGETQKALGLLTEMMQHAQNARSTALEAEVTLLLGQAVREAAPGGDEKPIAYFRKCMTLLAHEPVSEVTWRALFELARELFERGQRERAKEHLRQAAAVLRFFASKFTAPELRERYLLTGGRREALTAIQHHLARIPT